MIVCNTSPLILLGKVDLLWLPSDLYDNVLLPAAVLEEINAKPGPVAKTVQKQVDQGKLTVSTPDDKYIQNLPEKLGSGEQHAIALAIQKDADLAVLDDQEGRKIARDRGLQVSGTIGLVIEAKYDGTVKSVREVLDKLIESGFWLDEELYHVILQEVDE